MTFTNTFKRKACRVIAALAAVACTMSLAACGADETGKIRIGIKFDQPGLGFKKSGTYVGFDVDVAKYVAKKLGYSEDQIIWKEAPSKQREAMIQNGDVDMILATYSITDERKKSWDFSTPYRTDYVGLMVKKRSGFTSIEDLDGKVIGVSQGATTQGLIEQMIKDNGFSCKPEFRAFSGYPIIKSSLDAGNIDVFAMDRSTLAGYMNETVELLQPEVKFGEQGYGVATKKGCDLSAVVDQVICDRLADGWLDQEVKTWGLV